MYFYRTFIYFSFIYNLNRKILNKIKFQNQKIEIGNTLINEKANLISISKINKQKLKILLIKFSK